MPKIAIAVEFKIKEGQHAAFDAIIREHARLTLQEEPGCERFDVLQPL
jgi:(4S)-4-hydroxy-5-phosphonooxypentane-2,3-dione isomerase